MEPEEEEVFFHCQHADDFVPAETCGHDCEEARQHCALAILGMPFLYLSFVLLFFPILLSALGNFGDLWGILRMAGGSIWVTFEEMLKIVAGLLASSAHVVKGITFDAHQAHSFFKEALFGYFATLKDSDDDVKLAELPFFSEVEYVPLPRRALPRLPMNLCRFRSEFIWPLPGSCSSNALTTFDHPISPHSIRMFLAL